MGSCGVTQAVVGSLMLRTGSPASGGAAYRRVPSRSAALPTAAYRPGVAAPDASLRRVSSRSRPSPIAAVFSDVNAAASVRADLFSADSVRADLFSADAAEDGLALRCCLPGRFPPPHTAMPDPI